MTLNEIIKDKLYLGNAKKMEILKANNIKYVLNFAKRKYDGRRRNFPLKDCGEEPERLLIAVEKLRSRMKKRGKVYVHCAAGVNRSPTVIAIYLVKYGIQHDLEFYKFNDALKYLKLKRKNVNPKPRMKHNAKVALGEIK